jgi:hypothetical protein
MERDTWLFAIRLVWCAVLAGALPLLRRLGLRWRRWQQGIAGAFVEHGALVAAPIGINAGMRLARRQVHSYSGMSWRRVREPHLTIVRGRTIIAQAGSRT